MRSAGRRALPNVPLRWQAEPLVARRARMASAVVPDLQGRAGRAVHNAEGPARRSAAHRPALSRTLGAARRSAGMGGARAVGRVGGAGSLLWRWRQSRQHLGRHARARQRGGARPLEQRGGEGELPEALAAPIWGRYALFRGHPRITGLLMWEARARSIAIAGERGGRKFEEILSTPPGRSQRSRSRADGQHAATRRATRRHRRADRHVWRGRGGLGDLWLVRALWQSVGGGAASGGALLLKALPAGRLPRPVAPALRPRRPDRPSAAPSATDRCPAACDPRPATAQSAAGRPPPAPGSRSHPDQAHQARAGRHKPPAPPPANPDVSDMSLLP